MWFSLIICTYNRADSLHRLLESVSCQSLMPNEILIIDASEDERTKEIIEAQKYRNLRYYKVNEIDKGLTRQRNYGIKKIDNESKIISFLDDDIVLEMNYFKNLISTYDTHKEALAVGGYILEDIKWTKSTVNPVKFSEFELDGYKRKLGSRYELRKLLNLLPNKPPGYMPEYSHGFPIAFLPPSNKTYAVEFFMGGVSSYRATVFKELEFSKKFIGYGLYEDMDFCLRLSKFGSLYVNTSARVYHMHDTSGRPNYYKYGKMMIENGYDVWRTKYPSPKFSSIIKWYLINYLLILVRLTNIMSDPYRKRPLLDCKGRIAGLLKLAQIK